MTMDMINNYGRKFLDWFMSKLGSIAIALIFLAVCFKAIKIIVKLLRKAFDKSKLDKSVAGFFISAIRVLLQFLVILTAASMVGFQITSFITLLGTAGVTIGLALQGSLSNLAGGVLILLLKPFRVGDYIITAGAEGTVMSIDIFYTRIATTDNKVVVIPNGTISNSNVTNTTKQDERMLVLEFTVSLDANIEEVKTEIMKLIEGNERILHEMNRCVVVDKLTPVNIKMQAKAWTKSEDYWDVKYLLLEQISIVLQGFRG